MLLEIDGGTCTSSHRLRARALIGLGRLEDARKACEAEVANGAYATQAFLSAPRASVEVQGFLRQQAAEHGFGTVDLPQVFSEDNRRHSHGPLPGNRLFLDYCHLSSEGIAIAMQALATKIVAEAGKSSSDVSVSLPDSSSRSAVGRRRIGTPTVEAVARFGAAIHSAHRLLTVTDKQALITDWCRESLAADPGIADAMLDVLHARCGPTPAVLSAAQQRNLESPYRLSLQHGWRWSFLDIALIEAIRKTLREAGRDVDDTINTMLLQHYGLNSKGRDLTQPPYLWEPLERFYPEAMARRGLTDRATLRSPWPESKFCLIANGEHDVILEIISRLPASGASTDQERGQEPGERLESRSGEVQVRLNGELKTTVEITERWTTRALVLPRETLHPVINRLTLVWPMPEATGEVVIENVIQRLENGLEVDFHPVFGEIFSLIARTDLHEPVSDSAYSDILDRNQRHAP